MLFSKNTFGSRVFSIVKIFVLNLTKASCFSRVEPEDRVFAVDTEDRLFEIDSEIRMIQCPSVCAEDRTFIVQGKCNV